MSVVEKRFAEMDFQLRQASEKFDRSVLKIRSSLDVLKPMAKRADKKDSLSFDEVQKIEHWDFDTMKIGPLKFKLLGEDSKIECQKCSHDVWIWIECDIGTGSVHLPWRAAEALADWIKAGPRAKKRS